MAALTDPEGLDSWYETDSPSQIMDALSSGKSEARTTPERHKTIRTRQPRVLQKHKTAGKGNVQSIKDRQILDRWCTAEQRLVRRVPTVLSVQIVEPHGNCAPG